MRTLHTSYRVSNLAASLDFYTALGYEQVGRVDLGANASLTMLKFPGEEVVTLELVHRPEDEPVDYRHRVQSHSSPGRRSRCQAWAVIGGEAHRLRRHLAKSLGNCRQGATTPFSTARQGVATRATRRRSSSGATTSTSDARVRRECSACLSFLRTAYPPPILRRGPVEVRVRTLPRAAGSGRRR